MVCFPFASVVKCFWQAVLNISDFQLVYVNYHICRASFYIYTHCKTIIICVKVLKSFPYDFIYGVAPQHMYSSAHQT